MLKPLFVLFTILLCFVGATLPLHAEEARATVEFRLAVDDIASGWQAMSVPGSDQPLYVSDEISLDGSHIEKVSFYEDPVGIKTVGLSLTDAGTKAMEATTAGNINKKFAIVVGGEVISAPTIRSTISKEVAIQGSFDDDQLLLLFKAIVLRESLESDQQTGRQNVLPPQQYHEPATPVR